MAARSTRFLAAASGALAALVLASCTTPPPARPSAPIHQADDYLARTQERTYREFLVGPANLRETGVPPTFQEVADKSTRKFVRGLANVTTGWVEIPKQVYNTWYQERGLVSPFIGFGKGVGMAVSREVAGVIELALPIAPAPGDWRPIIEPEFVFQSELPKSALKPAKVKKVPWWRRGKKEGGDAPESAPAEDAGGTAPAGTAVEPPPPPSGGG